MKVGYARVSTQGQDAGFEDQYAELRAAKCGNIVGEKASAVGKRPMFENLLASLKPSDVLVVTKMDRLARDTAELLRVVADLDRRSVGLIILSMGGQVVDSRTATGKFMLTVLGAVAEMERGMIVERQRAGIVKAQAEGKYKGRAPTARNQLDRIKELHSQGISIVAIAAELGINRATVHRLLSKDSQVSQSVA
jgi:DNA invertase Pin-like site-specific DNA recombinase